MQGSENTYSIENNKCSAKLPLWLITIVTTKKIKVVKQLKSNEESAQRNCAA